jgi:phosphate transport system substrate-binding protein
MSVKVALSRTRFLQWPLLLGIALASMAAACAQPISTLGQAKTIYIKTFSGGTKAAQFRQSFVNQLSKARRFQIVQSPSQADAVVTGMGQAWVRGHVAVNPKTPAYRQAVYTGYLSLSVSTTGGQPLWSWLVTPSKLVWTNIIDDLAGNAVRKLIEAADSPNTPSAYQAPSGTLAETSLTAAGSTFAAPLYLKWFEDFEQHHPGVHIHYSPTGSQLGVEQLAKGGLDFAGSDVAPEVVIGSDGASHLRRIATVLGAVVPIYNLRGVTHDLHFTPETLADIYLGRVRRWNDPEILRSNKGVSLRDEPIVVIHRSDGSGTTWVWSDFLSKNNSSWSSSVGRGTVLEWPIGIGAEHNEGVSDAVRQTPNSIGYVEMTFAIQNELTYAAVRNKAGNFIHADLDSILNAAKTLSDNGGAESITDSSGKFAYPIAAFTWLVIPAHIADPAKRAALVELLRWILTSGQAECSALGYVPIPHELAESELQSLNSF